MCFCFEFYPSGLGFQWGGMTILQMVVIKVYYNLILIFYWWHVMKEYRARDKRSGF